MIEQSADYFESSVTPIAIFTIADNNYSFEKFILKTNLR